MSTVEPLAAILVAGLAMSLIAFVGALVLLLGEKRVEKVVLPLVALSSGSLIGGALFHLLPGGVARMGNVPAVYIAVAAGFLCFLFLEHVLYWHHCHRPAGAHRKPMGLLLLIGDGVHNFIGGLAIGAAFVADVRLGALAWAVAAMHEIPQELGDFGVLVHSGWPPRHALAANFVSALTFPLGGVVAWSSSSVVDVSFLLPFAAGNFLYIGAADLVPQFREGREGRPALSNVLWWAFGLGLLLLAAVLYQDH
ncbi:MAG: ZIP family metal transporter [Gammaproteobacteria bacterium]|jgi:zinc and cadmium transporter